MIKVILKITFPLIILILFSFQSSSNQKKVEDSRMQDISKPLKTNLDYGRIPLYFIPNEGQVDKKALFYVKTSRYTLWVTKEGLVFHSTQPRKEPRQKDSEAKNVTNSLESSTHRESVEPEDVLSERKVSRLIFRNANKSPEVTALDPADYKVNYLIGNDPTKWKKDIPTSLAVLYKEIYPGIDLKVYGREKQIEYDWVIKPRAHVEDIRFEYQDVEKTEIDREGNLLIRTMFGELVHKKPLSHQSIEGKKIDVVSQFKSYGKNIFGFTAEDHREDRELVIDPVILVYSTYLGRKGVDTGSEIAVDKTGAAYVTGSTDSLNFPVKNAFQNKLKGNNDDVFVTKFAPAGNALIYSTFLGGDEWDHGYGIAVDSSRAVFITGVAQSSNFPLKNPYQSAKKGGNEVFVTKLAPKGNALIFSTYLGGTTTDIGYGIALDNSGAVYITGKTMSSDFPLQNPFQTVHNGGYSGLDAFVTKFTPQGNSLVYSTFLGGQGVELGNGIAVDGSGAAYVTGRTETFGFPLQNPFQSTPGGRTDVFVTKFTPAGNTLAYSTLLGGNSDDEGFGIALDSSGAAYVTGSTGSSNFPLKNPYQKDLKLSVDSFVTKFTPEGNALAYSTFLGGNGTDAGHAIALDDSGAAYITGSTRSLNFPLLNPCQKEFGGYTDAFVTKFTPRGNALIYSTYLGGTGEDIGNGIAVDNNGAVYIAGSTKSTDFPLQKPFQKKLEPKWFPDAFAAKLIVGSVKVISPNGGETWKVNRRYKIKWKYSGSIGKRVKIELLKDNKLNRTISRNMRIGAKGKGSFKWKVPSNQTLGKNFKIRITSKQVTACADSSNRYFKIVQ